MKNRKILTGLALGAVLVMVAAACGGKAKTTSSGGTDKCRAADAYRAKLAERHEVQARVLATLTGWDLDEIRRRMALAKD